MELVREMPWFKLQRRRKWCKIKVEELLCFGLEEEEETNEKKILETVREREREREGVLDLEGIDETNQ